LFRPGVLNCAGDVEKKEKGIEVMMKKRLLRRI
jgi:hypothetical protein